MLVARESSPSLFGKILALCSEAGFSPQIVGTGVASASVALLVEAGEGIAILPSNLRHGAGKNLAFCPLTNRGASIGLFLAWSPQREGPVLNAFLNLVRDYPKWPFPPKAALGPLRRGKRWSFGAPAWDPSRFPITSRRRPEMSRRRFRRRSEGNR